MKIPGNFLSLETRKKEMLTYLSEWSDEEMKFRPAAGAWSADQVVDHLVKVETSAFESLQANITAGRIVSLENRARAWMVITVMNLPIRVKVPPGADVVLPSIVHSRSEVIEQWTQMKIQWEGFWGTLDERRLSSGVFHHPVSGWMTVPTALAFLSAHIRHHGYQLRRIKRTAERRRA
jgi:hypothetical protein